MNDIPPREYHFPPGEIESRIAALSSQGITRLTVRDSSVTGSKKQLLRFIALMQEKAPDVSVDFFILPQLVDHDTIRAFSEMYCSLLLPVPLFGHTAADKKSFARKITLLNNAGLVFGFELIPETAGSLKQFRETLDVCISQYPNHVYFDTAELTPSALLSAGDIRTLRRLAFAAEVFYSGGRAVPWFLSVLRPLKLPASRFFADFAEWQQCNNCAGDTGFSAENAPHTEIEQMQLLFLRLKYEEKQLLPLFPAVTDLVRLHGAFSRAAAENGETVLELSYNPDDLFSSESLDLFSFADSVCMEQSRVRVFPGADGPDIRCC